MKAFIINVLFFSLHLFSDKKASHKDDKTITKIAELETIMDRLEKITEIPSDCTYANDQAVDKEVSRKTFLILKKNLVNCLFV